MHRKHGGLSCCSPVSMASVSTNLFPFPITCLRWCSPHGLTKPSPYSEGATRSVCLAQISFSLLEQPPASPLCCRSTFGVLFYVLCKDLFSLFFWKSLLSPGFSLSPRCSSLWWMIFFSPHSLQVFSLLLFSLKLFIHLGQLDSNSPFCGGT